MVFKVHPLALFACALMVITATTLEIPFSKFKGEESNRFDGDHISLKAEGKSQHSANQHTNFYGSVTIGRQSLPVLYSTTADMDFIVGKDCINCQNTAKAFDASQEPSFIQTHDHMTIDNGRVKGKLSMCSFKVSGQSGGQTEFVLAENVKYPLQHSGVLSLSPKSTSFLTAMYEKGLIDEKIFSLKYTESHPSLHFGLSEESLESFDYFHLHNKDSWSVELDSLSLASQELSRSPAYALFDTSTDLFILPEYSATNVLSALSSNGWECQADKVNKAGQLICERNADAKAFSLGLKFDGVSYDIPSSRIMGDCLASPTEGASQYCSTLIAVNNKEDAAVLGHSILQHFEIVFDAKVGRIGLAERIIDESGNPTTRRQATRGILFLSALGLALLVGLASIAWVVQKRIMRKKMELHFEEDSETGGVELATTN